MTLSATSTRWRPTAFSASPSGNPIEVIAPLTAIAAITPLAAFQVGENSTTMSGEARTARPAAAGSPYSAW